MNLIQINTATCRQCGVCAATCPGALIDYRPRNFPESVAMAEIACTGCGHCVAVCPTGSLSHRDMSIEACKPLHPEYKISPEQVEQFLRQRRSIRAYKKQPVPRKVTQQIIEIARYAPTGHNNQNVEWIVFDSPEKIQHLEDVGTDWIRWMIQQDRPMLPDFDLNHMLERQEASGNGFLRGAPVVIITHGEKNPMGSVDSSLALTYLDLAANSLGLGCCWAGFVMMMAKSFTPMQEALALPAGHEAQGVIMMGYPRFVYQRLPARKPPRIVWR
jgi:nitroreductase/NAD-dependent dihydropyrimidine dehydrogenase PreA subunit